MADASIPPPAASPTGGEVLVSDRSLVIDRRMSARVRRSMFIGLIMKSPLGIPPLLLLLLATFLLVVARPAESALVYAAILLAVAAFYVGVLVLSMAYVIDSSWRPGAQLRVIVADDWWSFEQPFEMAYYRPGRFHRATRAGHFVLLWAAGSLAFIAVPRELFPDSEIRRFTAARARAQLS